MKGNKTKKPSMVGLV